MILRILTANDQTSLFTAIAQLHHTVVAKPEALCCISHGWRHSLRRTRNLQQKLMLLGLKVYLSRCLFAEVQKPPQFVTELSKHLELLSRARILFIYLRHR